MSKYKVYFKFLIVFFVFCSSLLTAQISATPSVGCVPLTVNFTSPAGATNLLWNFGNNVTANVANPSNNYTSAGTFTVSLTCNLGTFTTLVVVRPKPTANFNFAVPVNGCAVRTVTFTDQSSASAGSSISNWQWAYGDGGSSFATGNHTYGYTVAGSFSVTLKVTDNNNCDNTITKGVIHVSKQPTVVVSSPGLNSCVAPFTTAFSGSNCVSGSPLGGGLTYNWTFGNSTPSSTQQNPGNVTYNTQGNYNVVLSVTDNNNCSNSTTVQVSVNQPAVKVKIRDTLCIYDSLRVRDSSNVPFTVWNVGDGSPTFPYLTTTNPVLTKAIHLYNAPGNYSITITASSGTCVSTLTKTLHVQQVVANFTTSLPSYTCSKTFLAPMVNLSSSNATTYTWTYQNYSSSNTTTSTATNPTFTYVVNSLNPYHIYSLYNPVVSLIAKSHFGCISTFTLHAYDSIRRPTAWFSVNKREGCAPLVVTFNDSSFTNTSIYPITSYTWNNGATPATLVNGTIPPPMVNPTFTYAVPGIYKPYLIIQTPGGCIDTSFVDTITAVNPPVISFSVGPNIACWNQPIQIINTSPPTTPPIQHWHVQSDNSFFSHCINDPNPSELFTHFGPHTFTMSGYLHSCKGTAVSSQTIFIKGPIVQGRFETNCAANQRKTVIFSSNLQDAQSATLNYGDGTPAFTITGTPNAVVNHSISHTYSATGNYTATLTGFNASNACAPYTYTMLVRVRDVQANFTLPAVGCASISTIYNASSSIDVAASCGRGYLWYFDNLPPKEVSTPTVSYTLLSAGIHTVMLYVRDVNGCSDTAIKTIRISSAATNFAFGANPLCYSTGTVQMLNTTSGLPDPITSYTWNSGIGTSTVTSPIFNYGNTFISPPGQTFTVSLIAVNSIGCIDTLKQILQVNNPSSFISPNQNNICVGNTVNFLTPQGYPNYTFTFGSSTQSLATSSYTAAYTYTNHGVFSASVQIQDAGGCRSTSNVNINVQSFPTASFVINAANSVNGNNICSGAPVTFSDVSTSNYPINYNWNLNTGSSIVNNSVVVNTYTASQNSTIPISLTVSTTNGCSSVFSNTFNIFVAKASINLNKSIVCFGESITVNLKDTSSLHAWVWGFGDGTPTQTVFTNPSNPSFTIHPYTFYPSATNGATTLSLIYFSSQLACRYSVEVPIEIRRIDANFIRNTETIKIDSVHCLGKPDTFSNTTPNSVGFQFTWNFGNGASSTANSPNYTYPNAGIYAVSLTVKDPINNCVGTSVKNMTIHALPNALINSPDSICQNAPFNLVGVASGIAPIVSYQWTPTLGLSSPNASTTNATASVTSIYSLTVTDANGCVNGTVSSIYVQEPPLPIQWDTTVIIGQQATMNGYAGNNMTYSWTPSTAINCTNCLYPTSNTTTTIVYSVTVADNLGCFSRVNTYSIEVLPKATLDVPTAFTPNGDGKNDIIYADGWGVRKLNYFRIYNRWGQLLFESNDIKIGWDGVFNGVPQNMETYVYQVSGETFLDDKALLKTGTFKLIR